MPEFEAEQESRLWRWMLGIVVLALVIWAAAELTGSERRLDEQASAGPAAVEAPVEAPPDQDRQSVASVTGAAFQAWVRDSADVHERLDAFEYAVSGLRRMLSTVRGLAIRSADSELELRATALESAADRLTSGDAAAVGAIRDLLLNSADLGADALRRAGTGVSADQNVQDARLAAEALNPDSPLERQRHRLFNYFDHMSEAIARAADLSVSPQP